LNSSLLEQDLELETQEAQENDRKTPRVVFLTLVVVLLGAFGNLSLAWGMKHITVAMGLNPLPYLHAAGNPFVSAGVVLLILWMLTRMALMSRSDLSFVLPATASGYVLNAILSVVFLKETLSGWQWLGTMFIFAGAALVASDPKGLYTSGPAAQRK
jgi:uncharacterized membrane protein